MGTGDQGNPMRSLGICIPAYKRPALLHRCIESAMRSAGGRPVRIFIADDSVDDTNSQVLAELGRVHSCITVYRNCRNLGIDANIQQAVDLCDCDYAWLIGEDDVFLSDAVARMQELIQIVDTPFIFANYAFVGEQPDDVLGAALSSDASSGYMSAREFIQTHLWAAGFIGACVLRRTDWQKTNAAPYLGTYFAHVGRIAEMLAEGTDTNCWVNSQHNVGNRVRGEDTFTWRGDSYGVFFGFTEMCQRVARRKPSISSEIERAARAIEKRYRLFSLRLAVRLRSEGGFDQAQFNRHLRSCKLPALKKLILFMISIAPPSWLRPIVAAYRSRQRLAWATRKTGA